MRVVVTGVGPVSIGPATVLAPAERASVSAFADRVMARGPNLVGGYYEKSAERLPSPHAQDTSVEQRLWEQTSAWLG